VVIQLLPCAGFQYRELHTVHLFAETQRRQPMPEQANQNALETRHGSQTQPLHLHQLKSPQALLFSGGKLSMNKIFFLPFVLPFSPETG
jgi:hypothetical protein